jgi:hypothetical protein
MHVRLSRCTTGLCWKASEERTQKRSNSLPQYKKFPIHLPDPSRLPCGNRSGCCAMDGKADRLVQTAVSATIGLVHEIRVHRQTTRLPTMAFGYAFKIPSASTENGLGTGLALAFSHAIHGNLQFAGEFYGDTQLNTMTPGFASSLWALTYTIIPRLVIDGGYEVGLTTGGPHRHAFLGLTYSITNLYPGWRRKQSRNP